MEMYFVCRVAVAPLRNEPSDQSEIVSQLLFGDRVVTIEMAEKWYYVKTLHDNYEGWIDPKQLKQLTDVQYHDEEHHQMITALTFDNRLVDDAGTTYYLSPGSTLPFYKDGYCYLREERFEVKTAPIAPNPAEFVTKIEETAKFFLNSPYLWGGRTFFGIDCSGFTQTVYKLLGLGISRDASQQVEQGQLVDFLASSKLGDLAFFDNDEGKITHVGLMLSNDKIIHSSGKVRIDPIDNQGIYNMELDRYTHKLRVIKRFI